MNYSETENSIETEGNISPKLLHPLRQAGSTLSSGQSRKWGNQSWSKHQTLCIHPTQTLKIANS